MIHPKDTKAIYALRRKLIESAPFSKKQAEEGGCGVIGIIGTNRLDGRFIIRSLEQMQNRGNGKGGGVAATGLFDGYENHYALHIAYLDIEARGEVEKRFITPFFDIAERQTLSHIDDHHAIGLEVRPPEVVRYFVRVKQERIEAFMEEGGFVSSQAAEDELVYQNSFRLNREFYAIGENPKAFVLSHAKDLMILKGVGYAEQIARYYRLEETKANVWIGHQRYPTRGRVWHPGGAHPFIGLNEALVHNGDFANYHAVTQYLRQRGIAPLFVTDTEVSVLLFDLYSRVLGYPLEYVIEALAPTPEGDFERLSKKRQRIYRALQSAHLRGSPDGPWFFIVTRNHPERGLPELIGITDVSMLRPQVFALQQGEKESYGAIASEKQAIDAFFEELSLADESVSAVAEHYWNARGGSFSDGGAFTFSIVEEEGRKRILLKDKFGHRMFKETKSRQKAINPVNPAFHLEERDMSPRKDALLLELSAPEDVLVPGSEKAMTGEIAHEAHQVRPIGLHDVWKIDVQNVIGLKELLQKKRFDEFHVRIEEHLAAGDGAHWQNVLEWLTFLHDRRLDPGEANRAHLQALLEKTINRILDSVSTDEARIEEALGLRITFERAFSAKLPRPQGEDAAFVIDATRFPPEGEQCVSRLIVKAYERGWRRFIAYRLTGDRFLGCGLGKQTGNVRIDCYGSSGDYLGSGIDGAKIFVHGNAQDQVGQIMKSGRIVIFGDVGQTFLYGAKGGEAFVMGNAAGRPLINAVGKIRAIINGTSLDYCAESFMAGRELDDGFVIINGLGFDERSHVIGLELKYPGNNLFSLASGGACYLNDPYATVSTNQLNGASFVPFKQADWNFILPYMRLNQALFGFSIRNDILMVDGVLKWPKEVFRKVVASAETGKLDWSSLPM